MYAEGYGDVMLEVKESWEIDSRGRSRGTGKPVTIKVRGVLYVPCFSYILLLLRQLTAGGEEFEGQKEYMVLRNYEKWMFTAECTDSMYRVIAREWSARKPVAFTVHPADERAKLWHACLGHLSFGNVKHMVNETMLRGMNVSSEKLKQVGDASVCEGCVMGRHPRKVFRESDTKQKQCLELIDMDLCGPMSVDSHGGSRYIATFLDDYSGLSSVVVEK